jgi:hypothetical protein
MSTNGRDWTKIVALTYAVVLMIAFGILAVLDVKYSGWVSGAMVAPFIALVALDARKVIDVTSDLSDLRIRIRSIERKLGTESGRVIDTTAEPTGALVRAREERP